MTEQQDRIAYLEKQVEDLINERDVAEDAASEAERELDALDTKCEELQDKLDEHEQLLCMLREYFHETGPQASRPMLLDRIKEMLK